MSTKISYVGVIGDRDPASRSVQTTDGRMLQSVALKVAQIFGPRHLDLKIRELQNFCKMNMRQMTVIA